jgi:hypothetical protein
MKRKIKLWTLTMAITIMLAACSTSGRYSSISDDIYYSPAKVETASTITVKNTETTIEDAEIKQLKSETQAAIIQSAKKLTTDDSTIVVVEDAKPYKSLVSDSYEDSYERRLRGYNSPSYGMESVIRITTGSDWMQVTSYDPAFYNIIVMGDEIWVEPKYVTNMFSPVRTTINLGYGNGYYGGYWDTWYWPRFGYSWGWYNSWYNPWSWNYPSYWGWSYGWNGNWYHGNHHYNHGYYHNDYAGRGNGYNYGRRTSGTMGHNRITSSTTARPSVTGGTRRETRNIELVSNRTSSNASTSASVNAGNRRGNTANSSTGINQSNVNGRASRNPQTTADRTQAGQRTRKETQVYTRPASASRQGYNESTSTSNNASRRSSTSSGTTGVTRIGTTSGRNSETSSRSVSTSRYSGSNSSSRNSSNGSSNSSSSVSRRSSSSSSSNNSSSSSSSYTPSSSSSRSSSSSGSVSSGSSRSSGSGGGSSSSGGSRRR